MPGPGPAVRQEAEAARTATPLHGALTGRGKAFLSGAGIVAACGVALGYPELLGLGVAGVAAVAAALGSVARSPRVRVEREVSPNRVSRGARAVARVRVAAETRRATPEMTAHDLADGEPVPCPVPRLRPGDWHAMETELPTARRGVVASGPLQFDRGDVFGLAHRVITTGRPSDLYVRPRIVELPEVAASLARSVDGPDAESAMEGSLSFSALREYQPGDELRRVHWQATAHAGKLVVKQYVDTAYAAMAVVLDTRVPGALALDAAGAAAEPFESAVDCAASIAAIATAQRQPLRLVDGDGESLLPLTTRRVGCTRDDVLDALTPVAPVQAAPGVSSPDRLPESLRRLASSGRGSVAAVVTTRPTEWLADSLRLLAGSYARVLAIHVATDPTAVPGATRTGRVLWATVRQPEDLPHALLRARAAA